MKTMTMTLLEKFNQVAKVDGELCEILNVFPNTEAGGYTPQSSGGISVRIHSDNSFILDYHDGMELLYQPIDGIWSVVAGVHYDNGHPDREPQQRFINQDGNWWPWQAVEEGLTIDLLAEVNFSELPSGTANKARVNAEFAKFIIRCQDAEKANAIDAQEEAAEAAEEQSLWESARHYLHLMTIAKQTRKREDIEAAWAYWAKMSEAERELTTED